MWQDGVQQRMWQAIGLNRFFFFFFLLWAVRKRSSTSKKDQVEVSYANTMCRCQDGKMDKNCKSLEVHKIIKDQKSNRVMYFRESLQSKPSTYHFKVLGRVQKSHKKKSSKDSNFNGIYSWKSEDREARKIMWIHPHPKGKK